MTSLAPLEATLEPDLPIVDPHHHLWFLTEGTLAAMKHGESLSTRALAPMFRDNARYLFDELTTDLRTGHNIRATVYVNAESMYRASGPKAMKSVGEVEFVNGVAAMSASGLFGEVRACAGIVGGVDLRLGDAVEEVLSAHIRAGGGRYRGVRCPDVTYDEDAMILGASVGAPHVLLDAKFRNGFKRLSQFDLSYDAWLLEPQLPDLIDLARAFPDTRIILDHVGTPVGIGRYAGQRERRFAAWRENMRILAGCANVTVKLGGLGLPHGGFKSYFSNPRMTSKQLADEWKPYIETSIELFGADRCMFESNFPVDSAACTYLVVWNTFKRIVSGASAEDKASLFSETAKRVYRLEL